MNVHGVVLVTESGGGGLGEGGGGDGDGGGGDGDGGLGGGGLGEGGGGDGDESGGEGCDGGDGVIVIVLTTVHCRVDNSADHSPANRNDCPAPMATDCVETVISLLIVRVDPDTGFMVPSLGPTVQPDELPTY